MEFISRYTFMGLQLKSNNVRGLQFPTLPFPAAEETYTVLFIFVVCFFFWQKHTK